jgi:diacylglycerol kinase family enzyme
VIALGGDGTLNRVAQPIVLRSNGRPSPAVAFVPLGTANVATRAFRLPRRLDDVARLVAAGSVRHIDAGVVVRHDGAVAAFLLWLGAGLDGAVIHAVAAGRARYRGLGLMLRYLLETPRTFMRYRFPTVRIESEGTNGAFASVLLANVGTLAFGSATANADPEDGRVNVIATGARTRLGWCASALLAGVNAYDRCWGVSRSRETRVRLVGAGPLPVHIDGEPYGQLPVDVEVRPGALSLLAPGQARAQSFLTVRETAC